MVLEPVQAQTRSAFDEFIASRRTEATRATYRRLLKLTLKEPDAFIKLAQEDRRRAEEYLLSRIMEMRQRVKPSSLSVCVAIVKSYLDYWEVQLSWKRVRSIVPPGRTVALDRAPTTEEIRAGLKLASLRERVCILIMASGGPRVGALPSLKVRDLRFLASGVGALTVYAGEPEQYQTFITLEACEAVKDYLSAREREANEKVFPDSPLIRDKWDYQGAKRRVNRVVSEVPSQVKVHALALTIRRLWMRAGVRSVGDGRPWKTDHGLRKWFKTMFPASACPQHGELDVEILMGHYLSYHKPTPQHLEEVYLRAVPALSIDEKFRLKQEIQVKDRETSAKLSEVRLENLELKDKQHMMEKTIERQSKRLDSSEAMMKVMAQRLGLEWDEREYVLSD